jgi:hypothetical protein
MNKHNPKAGKGMVETVLGDAVSDEEMDRALAARRDEVEALLKQGRDEMTRGEVALLEPLHVLLNDARKRLNSAD